jgi:hypothetical protein
VIAAVLAVASGALGPVVLRGETGADPRVILRMDERGVDVQDEAGVVLIPWERVKAVVGEEAVGARAFLSIGDAAWRSRARLERGDVELATPLLEELFDRLRNVQSGTALYAAAGLVRARVETGELVAAVEPMLIASRLRADEFELGEAESSLLRFDAEWGLFVDLPPFFEEAEARALVSDWPEDIDVPLAEMYRAAALGEAGMVEAESEGEMLVAEMVGAMASGDAAPRESARGALRGRLDKAMGSWREAWIRGALGRSLLKEGDAAERDRGLIELLQVAARFSDSLPGVSAGSLRRVIAEAREAGGSAILEERLRGLGAGRVGQWRAAETGGPKSMAAASKRAQEFADFLDSAGLTRLLARFLEDEVSGAETGRRAGLVKRLAETYALLVESTEDDAERAALESRAMALLAETPDADTLEVRLRLARATYARGEAAAERWRLRLISRADADAARRSFAELEGRFAELATAAGRKVESLERQEESATGGAADRSLLAGALGTMRRTRSMGQYLAGWSAYYVAELDSSLNSEALGSAERHFGWLLNARPGAAPDVERVPEQLLSYEHVARSVMGVALVHSLRGSAEVSQRWLALLESGANVPAAVAGQLVARKLTILARAGRWADVAALVDPRGRGAAGADLSTTDARLLAVLALEAKGPAERAEVQALILFAVESLASRGELKQVLDLSSRYFDRLQEFGSKGFLPAYIRGLREYDRASRLHGESGATEDEPARDGEARRGFASAADFLSEALGAEDAASFESALGGVMLVRAIARFRCAEDAGSLERAAAEFVGAAERLEARDAKSAARARRMAIHAIDAAARSSAGAGAALADRRRELAEEFLRRHPGDPAAAALLYERAVSGRGSAKEAAADLLSIPDDSPLALAARHQAARLLYEEMLKSPAEGRAAAAGEFLAVAEPLIVGPRRGAAGEDAPHLARMVTTGRRLVDALLRLPQADARRVKRALEALDDLVSRDGSITPAVRAEVEYRHLQWALMVGEFGEAESRAARLRELDAALFASAERAIFQRSADLWREASEEAERRTLARRVVTLGRSILHEAEDLAERSAASVAFTSAEAASEAFAAEGDGEMGAYASEMFGRLMAAHPREARFLRAAADHAERAGDHAGALEARGRLLEGLAQGSPEWFEAKCRVIEGLIEVDAARAKTALEQHRVLFPDLGPPPWEARLRVLEARLKSRVDGAGTGATP